MNNIPKTFPTSLYVSKESRSEESCFKNVLNQTAKAIKNSFWQSAKTINWMIENRGGLAKIIGLVLLPAQHMAKDHAASHKIIDMLLKSNAHGRVEKIKIPCPDGLAIEGVICYPKNWDKNENSKCLLYHNPNGVATASFFEDLDYSSKKLSYTPGDFFKMRKCPIILYDYRGVGLNQDVISSFKFYATYKSIVADGKAALEYALSQFDQVEIIGSSLGGSVATASLDRHLEENKIDKDRIIQLINHDSFTTAPRVVFPRKHLLADCLGFILGAHLDAMTPMKNLIDRGIKVTVLCHTKDPVIPFGARMGDFIETLPKTANAKVFLSPSYGHANLSSDMINFLKS